MATKKPSGQGSKKKAKGSGRAKKKPAQGNQADSAAKPAQGESQAVPDADSTAPSGVGFPVVGVGASAGGLEAFVELLSELTADTGMAFVFIQHYRPDKPSMLTEILRRDTPMPVIQVSDGMPLEPNTVYVHPSYEPLYIRDGAFVLKPETRVEDVHMPIDYFLHALAELEGSQAIGVVLSGTASDGTLGLKAIKGAGGITLVQDTESARYDGMPASAISAGAATFVLSPVEIGRELVRIARHPYLMESAPESETAQGDDGEVSDIFALLRKRFGVDFTYYKHSTIMRRIRRRMVVQRLSRIADYVESLKKNPDEVQALYHDFLINVTGFFRDPAAFEFLRQEIFPRLLTRREEDDPLRIWVPGCSSGEEVYSIAMTLLDSLEAHQLENFPVQIFATDIDDDAIAQARSGIYPPGIAEAVPAAQLQRHFISVLQGYQINKQLRDMCVFSRHNVIKDPPFSRLDLISCRNLLIYLGPVLQKKVLPIFHFALKPGAFLLLGSAESIGTASSLFAMVDKANRIYSKKSVETPLAFEFHTPLGRKMPTVAPGRAGTTTPETPFNLHQAIDAVLVHEYSPPAVVINEKMEILEFRGHTGRFLEPAAGEASLNLLKMAREGLVAELRAAVIQAMEKKERVYKQDLRADFEHEQRNIGLEVVPIYGSETPHYYLVVFHDQPVQGPEQPEADKAAAASKVPEAANEEIQALHRELKSTKDYLHSVIEQQELSNEDLRCANEEVQSSYEELQSTNEELQSTNEELETAKEELQSTNEELRTVNDELENRNAELTTVNNDLHNLIASMDTAIAIVGIDGRIRRFSPRAQELLNLIETDIGRPISNIKATLPLSELEARIKRTVDKVEVYEEELADDSGHWYLLRIHPYRTLDNRIDGAVLVFLDINRLKQTLQESQRARDYAEAVIRAMRHPLLILDTGLKVVSVSEAYLDTFEVSEKETVGNRVNHLGNGQWAIPQLQQSLEAVLTDEAGFDGFEVEHDFPAIGRCKMWISGRRVSPGLERQPLILMQIEVAAE